MNIGVTAAGSETGTPGGELMQIGPSATSVAERRQK
jgi:hypothetical protein